MKFFVLNIMNSTVVFDAFLRILMWTIDIRCAHAIKTALGNEPLLQSVNDVSIALTLSDGILRGAFYWYLMQRRNKRATGNFQATKYNKQIYWNLQIVSNLKQQPAKYSQTYSEKHKTLFIRKSCLRFITHIIL